MADVSFYAEFARAVPVVIGGVLAISGGILGQLITHRLSGQREQSTLRIERLEAFVKALVLHGHWLGERFTTMIFSNLPYEKPSPMDDASMIQTLYFPELGPAMIALLEAEIPLLQFISDQRVKRLGDEPVWLKDWSNAPYLASFTAFTAARSSANIQCRQLIQKVMTPEKRGVRFALRLRP